jgi:hypothetical protein
LAGSRGRIMLFTDSAGDGPRCPRQRDTLERIGKLGEERPNVAVDIMPEPWLNRRHRFENRVHSLFVAPKAHGSGQLEQLILIRTWSAQTGEALVNAFVSMTNRNMVFDGMDCADKFWHSNHHC